MKFFRGLGSGHGYQRELAIAIFVGQGGCACTEGDLQPDTASLYARLQVLRNQTKGGGGWVDGVGRACIVNDLELFSMIIGYSLLVFKI